MAKNLLSGSDAAAPAFAARRILRDALIPVLRDALVVLWQENESETPSRGVPLVSVRGLKAPQRNVPGVGRQVRIEGEIRVAADPKNGGVMYRDRPALVDAASDALDAWLFEAAFGGSASGGSDPRNPLPTGIKAQLESLGIYDVEFDERVETTDEKFKHVNKHPFACKVFVAAGNSTSAGDSTSNGGLSAGGAQ